MDGQCGESKDKSCGKDTESLMHGTLAYSSYCAPWAHRATCVPAPGRLPL